jgi:hypothetical protein
MPTLHPVKNFAGENGPSYFYVRQPYRVESGPFITGMLERSLPVKQGEAVAFPCP